MYLVLGGLMVERERLLCFASALSNLFKYVLVRLGIVNIQYEFSPILSAGNLFCASLNCEQKTHCKVNAIHSVLPVTKATRELKAWARFTACFLPLSASCGCFLCARLQSTVQCLCWCEACCWVIALLVFPCTWVRDWLACFGKKAKQICVLGCYRYLAWARSVSQTCCRWLFLQPGRSG